MDIISSILELPKQCEQAVCEAFEIKLPKEYRQIKNIVVCSMGGSALAAHAYKDVFWPAISKPLEVVSRYELPNYARDETLVVLSSYSGNTEEVLACAEQARNNGAKVVGITSGGKLAEWLKQYNYPVYLFIPTYNSTGQPRLGMGYGIFGLMGIISLIEMGYKDDGEFDYAEDSILEFSNISEKVRETAEKLAPKLINKTIAVFAAERLSSNAHILANQLNETAKTYASWHVIPEANHHFLEGLKHPDLSAAAIFLTGGYSERTLKRFEITREILEKNDWEVFEYKPTTTTPLSKLLETLLFSSLITAYLAKEYGEDPVSIPTVDYFKEKLN